MSTENKIQKSLGEALFPKIKRQLLSLFFLNEKKAFYYREIIRILDSSPGSVQKELKNLVDAEIITTKFEHNHRYYRVNRDCSILKELKGIVFKTFGVADIIKGALTPIEDKIHLAVIHGSVARGEDTGSSDIDLLVVGDVTFKEIALLIDPIEKSLHRPVNPSVYSESEFKEKLTSNNHFIKTVMKSKLILLFGELDDA